MTEYATKAVTREIYWFWGLYIIIYFQKPGIFTGLKSYSVTKQRFRSLSVTIEFTKIHIQKHKLVFCNNNLCTRYLLRRGKGSRPSIILNDLICIFIFRWYNIIFLIYIYTFPLFLTFIQLASMYGDDTLLIVVIKNGYFPARNNHDRGKREFAFSLLLVTLSIK